MYAGGGDGGGTMDPEVYERRGGRGREDTVTNAHARMCPYIHVMHSYIEIVIGHTIAIRKYRYDHTHPPICIHMYTTEHNCIRAFNITTGITPIYGSCLHLPQCTHTLTHTTYQSVSDYFSTSVAKEMPLSVKMGVRLRGKGDIRKIQCF